MSLRKSPAEKIYDHAMKFVLPFRSTAGHAWAVIPTDPLRHRGEPISSRGFREWLAAHFYNEHGIFPGQNSLDSAVAMLQAQARYGAFPADEVFTRIGFRGDRRRPDAVLLHLANAQNEVLQISADGRTLAGSAAQFLSSAETGALSRPVDSPATPLEHLRSILRLPDAVLQRALIWLYAAVRPAGPYPILVITGPQGCGKTTLARTLRDLIDPAATLLNFPPNENHLFSYAMRHHILAFDDVAVLAPDVAAAIGRLASGAGVGIYSRNIVDDPRPIPLARPIIMTASARRRNFPSHAIHIRLQAVLRGATLDDHDVEDRAAEAAPAFLGSMCRAISAALSPASEAFPAAQLGLTEENIRAALGSSPLIDAIRALLQSCPAATWNGTATDLHSELARGGFGDLASSPRELSQQLNATPLTLFGIDLQRSCPGHSYVVALRLTPPKQTGESCFGEAS